MTLLTAEDVLNKKFQPTKFREGYDQDEVDDFLDEIVNTFRVMTAENEQLRANLAAAQVRIGELGGEALEVAAVAPVVAEAEEVAEVEEVEEDQVAETVEAEDEAGEPEAALEDEVEDEAAEEAQAEVEPEAPAQPVEQPAAVDAPASAAGMLALAQRVHDEYVESGQAEGERLLSEARTAAETMVREAEAERKSTMGKLETERALLERKIEELRNFERDYRTRLKSYLEGLIQDVEGERELSPSPNGSLGSLR